ncbi:MAG: alpha/beta hydrolase [Clostridia bacterium]|nr:alpha/beta hydrolase [Clostridia bacterium]
MTIIRKEFTIPSKTGTTNIFARCWVPESGAKAVFQIVHGMAEHGERYEDFAAYLCQKGFAVLVDDHAGHGKSVKSDDDLGYFGDEGGWDAFVEDEKALTELAKKEFPDIPIIFFGHSMGSFIAREYVRRYGSDEAVKGAIICGTSGKNPAAAIAIGMAGMIAKLKGSRHRSEFINKIAFGPYNNKIKNPKTPFDWLTTDEAIVDKYIADKYCGFLFTAAGYKDLFTILNTVSGKDWYAGVPKNLPLLVVAGEEDPVGSYGKGVKEVYNNLKAEGCADVTLKLYPAMRHEILNEKERATVYEDIAAWAGKKANL